MGKDKPLIGITIGDTNGIGPEIIIKAVHDKYINAKCTPIIYASSALISKYAKMMDLDQFHFSKIESVDQAKYGKINVVTVWKNELNIDPGTPTRESGEAAFKSIEAAVMDLKEGKLEAVVTAPIDKKNIQSEDFKFPGHTEYLFKQFNAKEGLMILHGDQLTVASVTGHIAISDVAKHITREKIVKSAKSLAKSLKKDFGIEKPKVAILGLNPHASDNGMFGHEENDIIGPAVQVLQESNILAFGPYPPDGFFGTGQFEKFDGVLGMYHDQVLIPFKLMEFETGVNFTSGLQGVRTSPDHGTAFDIAGKNKASAHSISSAINQAIKIAAERKLQSN